MSESLDPKPAMRRKGWLPRLRFSLRTLLIFALFWASGFGLWYRWEPWVLQPLGSEKISEYSYSPDGRYFATTKDEKLIQVWDSETGTEHLQIAIPHHKGWFSPDSRWLLLSPLYYHESGDPCIYDRQTGNLQMKLEGHWCGIFFSKDNTLITGSEHRFMSEIADTYDSTVEDVRPKGIHIWNLQTGQEVAGFGEGFHSRLRALSPDGSLLATSDYQLQERPSDLNKDELREPEKEYFVRLWDLHTHQLVASLGPHLRSVRDVAFTPEGKRIATSSVVDVNVWEVPSGKKVCSQIAGSADLAFSPDGRMLVTTEHNPGLRFGAHIRDASTLLPLYELFPEGKTRIHSTLSRAQFSADGSRFMLGDCQIRDSADGSVLCELEGAYDFARSGNRALGGNGLWHRRRPEYSWGVAWLPEFWLTVLFAGLLVWSVWRDRKRIA